ncbi:unnamed protein product [Brassica napus]|uniref:(rape) hypothetical protein n=1 Tax=Brassica napus TaxID=3708 RepID=A0A816JR88_BRANA|nr:unnamed protein product [Brassica napus]
MVVISYLVALNNAYMLWQKSSFKLGLLWFFFDGIAFNLITRIL